MFVCDTADPVVQTVQGPVRGYVSRGLYIFKGIPYATAGRFHSPEACAKWTETLDCTSFGYVCPLFKLPKPNGELLVPHRYWPMDENCLNLNLWTPACDDKKRPVLVWFHGGGFTDGSAVEQVAYDGDGLAKEDVVVVTVNHRLNILGYFDLSEYGEEYADSANAGTEDLIASLRWIKENIAFFGGDPDNVLIFGQSGGGGKVDAILQMPAGDGLYHKAVNMSGVLDHLLADGEGSGKPMAEALMKELGVSTVKELETVPWRALFDAYLNIRDDLKAKGLYAGCSPKKNAFYLGNALFEGHRKETAHIPMMIGTVFAEFTAFMPPPYPRGSLPGGKALAAYTEEFGAETAEKLLVLFREAYPARPVEDLMMTDTLFRLPALKYIAGRSELNRATWAYLFDIDFPLNGETPAWHCSDIPFFFHNIDKVEMTAESEAFRSMEHQMSQSLLAFARTGDPNGSAVPEWKPCEPGAEHTMRFAEVSHVVTNGDKELLPALAAAMRERFERNMAENRDKIAH